MSGRANCAGVNGNYLNYPTEMVMTGIANDPTKSLHGEQSSDGIR